MVGFLWSTVLVYHATFCINSLAHVHGKQRYVTGDDSRNNWLLALFTMGEGWHNNHHAWQSSVRQGFRWWEADATFYILRALSWTGLVWDLKLPPEALLRGEQRLGARVIDRAAEQLAARFNPEPIARAIAAALHGPELAALQERARPRPAPRQRGAGRHAPAADAQPRRDPGRRQGHVRQDPFARRDRRPRPRHAAGGGRRAAGRGRGLSRERTAPP